jgi:hypothetical protein
LNAIAASLATNDFLMSVTGLLDTSALLWTRHDPRNGEFYEEVPRSDPACRECSDLGRLGKGALNGLPTKSQFVRRDTASSWRRVLTSTDRGPPGRRWLQFRASALSAK